MAKSDYEREVRDRVEKFVADIAVLIRRAALESVGEALKGKRAATTPAKTAKASKKAGAKRSAPGVVRGRRSRPAPTKSAKKSGAKKSATRKGTAKRPTKKK